MAVPKDSEKYPEYIKKLQISQRKRYENPDEHKKISEAHKGLKYPNRKPITEEIREKLRISHLGKKQSQETINKRMNAVRGCKHPPRTQEWRDKQRIAHLGKPSPIKGKHVWTIEQRKLIGDRQRGKVLSEEHRANISKGNRGRVHSASTREKISNTLKGHPVSPEQIEKQRAALTGRKMSDTHRMKTTEFLIGGFWYGNVRYPERKYYCELWTPELCNRIRAAWDYKSAISGKTKEENNGKALDCHHVYFQEKACCEWDEDKQGYYAIINLGTKRKPNFVRYDIIGDPNKFVPLTHPEHTMVRFNKLKWIKYFEELIISQNKVCYLKKQ